MKELPSIVNQAKKAGFKVAFYDFRKAKTNGLDYFNPALVRREDGLWLVTRRSHNWEGFEFGKNELMAFKLDENHLPQYGVPISPPRAHGEHFEDPRVFQHAGTWWVSACSFVIYSSGSRSAADAAWTGAHQTLLQLDDKWQVIRRRDPVYGGNSSDLFSQKGNEKNWLWFSHSEALHLVYMTVPHQIVRWNDSLQVEEVYESKLWHPAWKHGQPRGGSAPVRIGDTYFSFFHSSTPWKNGKRQYHMGAYTFEAKPPFKVTSVTPKPILSGSIKDPWGPDKPLVVFPCSAILEGKWSLGHSAALLWTISLGVNDLVSAYAIISHSWLLKKLSPNLIEPKDNPDRLSASELVYA